MSIFNRASTADLAAETTRAQKAETALAAKVSADETTLAGLVKAVAALQAAGTTPPVTTPPVTTPPVTTPPVTTPPVVTPPAGTLTPFSGSFAAAAKATVQNLDIQGELRCAGTGVTASNVKIRGIGQSDWMLESTAGFTGSNIEIGGGADGKTYSAAIGLWTGNAGNVFTNLEVHHTSDGIRLDGGATLINPNIHDLVMGDSVAPGAHSDGIQVTAGSDPIVIKGGTIEGGSNDAFFCEVFSGDVTLDGVHFKAGNRNGQQSSYGVAVYKAKSVTLTNCVFSKGWQVAPVMVASGIPFTSHGNTYEDGTPVV